MQINHAIEAIEEQQWLESASTEVQKALGGAVKSGGTAGKKIKNALNGTWLGHPLHPILTDVAIGGYTVAWFLDILGELSNSDRLRDGADQAMAVGMFGALGSVVTGLADWSDTDGRARNLGLLHAGINATANAMYITAFLNRKKNRPLRFWLSMAGATVLTAGAYLGGHLVYEEQIGVDHAKGQPFPEKFRPVMPEAELKPRTLIRKEIDGARILLLKQDGKIHAISEVCPHLGGPLAEGKFEPETMSVTCPWHGSRFSVEDGSLLDGPSTHPAPCMQTRVRNGLIEVKLDHKS